MEAKVISRRLYNDQFGSYICETLADGTKRNFTVKPKIMKSGRKIAGEWVDDQGYSYGVTQWQKRE